MTRDDLPISPQAPLMQFIVPQAGENPDLLPYWSFGRDFQLRGSVRRDGLWASAVHIATTKVAALTTEFSGDAPRLRDAAQQILLNAEDGAGQVRFLSRQVRDFLTTDNGCFTEIVRSGGARGARIIGVMHLDSMRCRRTGDPAFPVIYRDIKNEEHLLRDYEVVTYSDMPDATETWHGVGMCAASRAWSSILKMAAIERYYWEKISGNRAQSIDLINGLSFPDLRNATMMADEEQQAKRHILYKGAILIPTVQDTPPTHVRINFAELPDGFDYDKQFNTALLVYANAMGLDPQDLQPLTGRPMGSGDQSLILDEKAEQRGLIAFLKDFTHQWNENICPDKVTFGFTSSKLRRKKAEADIDKVRSDTATELVGKNILNGSQGKQWLVDHDVLPKEFLDTPDQTQEQTLDDEEKPEAEALPQGAVVPPPAVPAVPPAAPAIPPDYALKELGAAMRLFEELVPEAPEAVRLKMRNALQRRAEPVRIKTKERSLEMPQINLQLPNNAEIATSLKELGAIGAQQQDSIALALENVAKAMEKLSALQTPVVNITQPAQPAPTIQFTTPPIVIPAQPSPVINIDVKPTPVKFQTMRSTIKFIRDTLGRIAGADITEDIKEQ